MYKKRYNGDQIKEKIRINNSGSNYGYILYDRQGFHWSTKNYNLIPYNP